MQKVRTLIVDDEKEARQGLQMMLVGHASIDVIGACDSGIEAIHQIDTLQPDLVLLDIRMPRVNGFQVLNTVQQVPPAVIFITAHDEYALKAFEVHAIDYLLKPFTKSRLEEALTHALKLLPARSSARLLGITGELGKGDNGPDHVFSSAPSFPGKLIIKADGKIHFLPYESVSRVEAYDYYIKVHTAERFYLVRDSMKRMEQILPARHFIRIHKSHIINTGYIAQVSPLANNDLEVVLSTAETIRGSRHYAATLKKWWA